MTGQIIKILPDKGYGFIESSGIEYFFHKSDFNGHWFDLINDYGQSKRIPVNFVTKSSDRGPRAAQVTRLDFPNQAS